MLYAIKIQDAYELNVIEKGGGPAVEEATTADIIIVVMWFLWGAWKSQQSAFLLWPRVKRLSGMNEHCLCMQGIAFFSQHNPNDVRAPRGTIDMGAAQQKS